MDTCLKQATALEVDKTSAIRHEKKTHGESSVNFYTSGSDHTCSSPLDPLESQVYGMAHAIHTAYRPAPVTVPALPLFGVYHQQEWIIVCSFLTATQKRVSRSHRKQVQSLRSLVLKYAAPSFPNQGLLTSTNPK